MQVYLNIPENFYWNDSFKQFVKIFSFLIASDDGIAVDLVKGTRIVEDIFDAIVMKRTKHFHKVNGDLVSELTHLVQNLANVRDEWLQNHLISRGIVKVILFLCNEVKYGSYVCIAALDTLQEIIVWSESDPQRLHQVKQIVVESTEPESGEKGLLILETLALYDNEEVREKATEILEDNLDIDMANIFEDFVGDDDDVQFANNNQYDTNTTLNIIQMISSGQF